MKNQINQPTVIGYSDHKKHVKRLHIIYILLTLCVISWLTFAYQYHRCYTEIMSQEQALISKAGQTIIKLGKTRQALASIQAPEEMSMKEWIKWRVTSEGIDWDKFDCMVRHESNYNQYAINKNTNGTYDIGYLQINELHKLPREVAFDYKGATEWAINKIKHDGNYMAWYGYRNFCQ